MKKTIACVLLALPMMATAQNPVIRDQFSADPTARVFNNKVYLYPSHDIKPCPLRDSVRTGSAWKTIMSSRQKTLPTGLTMA